MAYAIGQYIIDNKDQDFGTLSGVVSNGEINTTVLAARITAATELLDEEHIPISSLDKIGVQAPPGSFFVINGEPIEIGRTGTYELIFNDIAVTSLKVLSDKTFIIDYKYII